MSFTAIFRTILEAIVASLFVACGAVGALGDWYASVAPRILDEQSGKTILLKGINAAGYVTESESFWGQGVLFPMTLILIAAILVLKVVGTYKSSALKRLFNGMIISLFLLLILGNGHLISLIKTGNWVLPCERSSVVGHSACFLDPDAAARL